MVWGPAFPLIEMKTVAEVELGSQVHAAARGIVAEQGDVGQQGTVVGGEILSAVQAAARQTRVIETVLGGIGDAVSGQGRFNFLRSCGNHVLADPGVRFHAGIAENVGTVQIRHHLEGLGRKKLNAGLGRAGKVLEKNARLGGHAGRALGDLFLRLQPLDQAGAYFPAFQRSDAQAAFRIQVNALRGRLGLGNLLGQHGITGNKGGDGKKRRKQYMFHMTVRQGRTRNCHNEDSMLTRIPGRPSQKGAQAVLFP